MIIITMTIMTTMMTSYRISRICIDNDYDYTNNYENDYEEYNEYDYD